MRVKKLLHGLGQPIVLFYALPWLMGLLVAGTVMQRSLGLYSSQKLFFSNFILWLGPVPLPSLLSVLALLGVSLLVKTILKSPWHPQKSGTLIVHLGALLLLLGGLLTTVTALEGNMVLATGDTQNNFVDYYQREWVIEKNNMAQQEIKFDVLHAGSILTDKHMPFHMTVIKTCRNCGVTKRQATDASYHGLAETIDLVKTPPNKQDEENLSGAVFTISGAGTGQDGNYVTFEDARTQPTFKIGANYYRIYIRKHPYTLPFSVRLDKLTEQTYPATDIAKDYESQVTVTDGALQFPARIRMNEPLRYRGYTLYQAEFNQLGGKEFSVLAVVHNTGRVLPYVASIVMCFGMLLHLFLMRRRS